MPIEVYSFFSGVGFLDLGFENAGFNIVFVNEYNERFLQAYRYSRRNNNHIPILGIATKMFGCICLMKNGKKLFQSITIEEIN